MSLSLVRNLSRQGGIKHPISLGALAAKDMTQYERNCDDLKSLNRQYGAMNFINVINNSSVNIAIDLDFTQQKRYVVMASSIVNIDMVMFQEFNVTNLHASTNITDGEVLLVVGYERPLMRER
jgi:hypothetical protein